MMPMKISDRQKTFTAYLFVGPWLLGFFVFTIVPLIFSLFASFCTWNLQEIHWVGPANYYKIFSDLNFWRCGGTTLAFGIISTPITLSFALMLALLIKQKVRGVKFFRALYFLPVVAASDVISTVAGSVLFSRVITFNLNLNRFGINLPEQAGYYLTVSAMLLTLGLWRTGIQMLIFLMGLNEVPLDFYEAAEIDGATGWQKFWWVTIPSISPLILLNLLLTIVESFTGLATAMQLVTRGNNQLFIWDYVNFLSYRQLDFCSGLAVTWVFILVMLGLIGFIYQLVNRKITYIA